MTSEYLPPAARRSPLTLPVSLQIHLSPDRERDALTQVADEIADSWYEDIDEAYPDGETGIEHPFPPKDRLIQYLNMTYPEDIPFLMQDDIATLIEAGAVAPFVATTGMDPMTGTPTAYYWSALYNELPRDFEIDRKDFKKLLKRYGRELGINLAELGLVD